MAGSVLLKSLPSGEVLTTGGSGELYAAGPRQVYVYTRGTTTQVAVYSDSALTIPLGQPLITGADGTPGGLPGYVASGQSIDVVDVLTGARTQAEPLLAGSLQGAVGATGPTGPPGVGAAWKGVWSSGTTYAVGDGVSRSNRPYVGNSASNLNHDPATDTGTNWTPVENGPNGWYDVKTFGAKGDGVTDDSTAIQATINAAKTNGGVCYFPPGTYIVGTTLNCDQNTKAFALSGANQGAQYQSSSATLVYTGTTGGTSGGLMHFNSASGFELCYLGLDYTQSGFTGDLITIDGGVHAADSQDWHIHHCTSRSRTGLAAGSARSIVRLNQAIIGQITNCHWTGASNPLRLGDPGGLYVVAVQIEKCTFNFAGDAMILIGSGDAETITIRDNTFEAGTNTTAIRAATTAVDGANSLCYMLYVEGNWFGDAGTTTTWVKGLRNQGGSPAYFIANQFGDVGTAGTAIAPDPTSTINLVCIGNHFSDGTAINVNTASNVVMFGNYFDNVVGIFPSTTGKPSGTTMIGNYSAHGGNAATEWNTAYDTMSTRIALGSGAVTDNFPGGAFVPGPTGEEEQLVLGSYNTGSLTAMGNKAAIYTIPSPTGGPNKLIVQASTGNSGAEVQIAAGTSPAAQLRVGSAALGFYGVAPIAQATRAGQLTDSTGGTVTTTLAAGITDTVAKNAIASLAAKVNALETIIHNLGLSA